MYSNLPEDFHASKGAEWSFDRNSGTLTVFAHPQSDIYIDPSCSVLGSGTVPRHDAVTIMTKTPENDFQLQATVNVDFKDTFDAGVLLLRANEKTWAKLCFEYSPDREPMVVSVVNKGHTSDDANAFIVPDAPVALRISRNRNIYSFHASLEKNKWIFIRAFSFDEAVYGDTEEIEVGFEAQSPNGKGCKVEFSQISLENKSLEQLRDGS